MARDFKVTLKQFQYGTCWEIEYIGTESNPNEIAAQIQLMHEQMVACFNQKITKVTKYVNEQGEVIEEQRAPRKVTPRTYRGYGR